MKEKKQFKPQTLRAILAALLVLIVLAGGGAFYLGLDLVQKYAIEVDHKLVDAEASEKQISQLQVLKSQLNQSNSLIQKADQVFSTTTTYQAQALSDVRKYADASGLTVNSTNFDDVAAGTASMTITLKQPVSYTKLVAFLNNIEGNLPKMQINSIALGQPGSGGADMVRTGDIKIGIAVR